MKKYEKLTERNPEEKKVVVTRLNRISGQIEGVKKMILGNKYCDEVLIQLRAIGKSIKSLANLILEKHIHHCVLNSIKNGNLGVLDELSNLLKRTQ